MYPNNTVNKIGRIGILLPLILGFMLISGTAVKAQYVRIYPQTQTREYQNYENRYENRGEMMRVARQNGYRNGFADGAAAARNRYSYDPYNSDYRSGMNNYNYGGNRYSEAYREGYAQGYRDGYRRNSRRGFQIRIF